MHNMHVSVSMYIRMYVHTYVLYTPYGLLIERSMILTFMSKEMFSYNRLYQIPKSLYHRLYVPIEYGTGSWFWHALLSLQYHVY